MELKNLTTFHIGGRAKYFYEIKNIGELIDCLSLLKKKKIKYYVLGNGSNLLISDSGVKGAVIKLTGDFKKIMQKQNTLLVGSAVSVAKLITYGVSHNLSGLEFLWGIPGTIGGAIKTNAGTRDKSVAKIVKEIKIWKNGRQKILIKDEIGFSCRDSQITDDVIITEVKLALQKRDENVINKNLKSYMLKRKHQPRGFSAGCIFRNPPGMSAGELIDRAGLKGTEIGGAVISPIHANFILNNTGKAKARDVWKLIRLVGDTVKKIFNIRLELEIKLWGDFK